MAAEIDKGQQSSFKEIEMLFNLLGDELLVALKTVNAYRNSTKGHRSKKLFLQKQHKELKEITDEIVGYITSQPTEMNDAGNFIKLLLSNHENIIIRYRESSSRIAVELHKDTSHFINNILEKHEKMAWALREQLK